MNEILMLDATWAVQSDSTLADGIFNSEVEGLQLGVDYFWLSEALGVLVISDSS